MNLILSALLFVVWAAAIAGPPSTLAVATTIGTIVAAIGSPFALRYVHLDGLTMSAASYGLALMVAVGAALLTGELQPTRESALLVLGGSASIWTAQQAVYAVFKQVAPMIVGAAPKASPVLPSVPAKPAAT